MNISKLEEKLIQPFTDAVILTLSVQCNTQCESQPTLFLESKVESLDLSIQIMGLITVDTKQFNGRIALTFNEKVFLKIYGNMMGEAPPSITPAIRNAAAELLNIIYGNAKTKLNDIPGFDLQLAIPSVLTGEQIKDYQNTNEKLIVMPFASEAGTFQLEIALENK